MKNFGKKILFPIIIALILTLAACGGESGFTPDNQPAEHLDRAGATQKKGVCVSRYGDGSASSAEKINNLGVSWYYNWSDYERGDLIDAEFVPMVWGAGSVNETTLKNIKAGYEAGKYKYLLTFNEPDHSEQSNMSVDQALALWPQLEALGIPLSSPAPSNYSTGWLDEFMTKAEKLGYRVDFLALHCYQDYSESGAHNKLKKELTEIYEKYGLPIWITEFAAVDVSVWNPFTPEGNPKCTLAAAKTYIKNTTDMLESLGFIERYSWFLDNFSRSDYYSNPNPHPEAPYTALYDPDDTLSATGEIYKNRFSAPALTINEQSLPQASAGKEYYFKLSASGGTGSYRFTSAAPAGVTAKTSLPRGTSVSVSGELYGTPKNAGEYNVCITVTDEKGQTAFVIFRLTVL